MFGTMAEIDGYSTDLSQRLQLAIGPLLLSLILYYIYSYLAYETTIKRSLYERIADLLPERIWRLLQQSMLQAGSLFPGLVGNRRGPYAQGQGLQKTYSGQGISAVVQRARSLSGFDKLVTPALETTFSGLGNWDNSCFQNSVLQGLASLPAFKVFVETSWRACVAGGVEAPALEGLQTFLGQLQEEIQSRRTIWPPSVLRSMNTWQQQDAQEYLSKILDSIEKETTKTQKAIIRRSTPGLDCLRGKFGTIPIDTYNGDVVPCEESQEIAITHLPLSSLDGYLSQKLRCQKCGFSEGVSLTSFNCLTLNLSLGGNSYLETMLDNYFEPETIDGVECDECTRLASESTTSESPSAKDNDQDKHVGIAVVPAKKPKVLSTKVKHILFGRLPQNLAIHVNRSIFDEWGNQRKNNSFVEFPDQLKIWGDWVEEFGDEEVDVYAQYELRCIINHSGRHDNGHYVTCGKRGKEWFLFNDELVSRITEENVLTRGNVFMLFYERVELGSNVGVSTPKSDVSQRDSPSLDECVAASEPETVLTAEALPEASATAGPP